MRYAPESGKIARNVPATLRRTFWQLSSSWTAFRRDFPAVVTKAVFIQAIDSPYIIRLRNDYSATQGLLLMSPILKGLATGDGLKLIYQQRSKTVNERTITAGSRFVLSFRPKSSAWWLPGQAISA